MTNTHRTGISQAVLVVVCLSLSYVSFALVHNIASTRSQGNFDVLVDQSLNLIHQQGDKFNRTLDGLAGLVLASDAVTSTELGEYADALNLHQDKLASTAIGFASLGEVTDQNPVNYVNTHLVESALPALLMARVPSILSSDWQNLGRDTQVCWGTISRMNPICLPPR